jgi:hypothetical protein
MSTEQGRRFLSIAELALKSGLSVSTIDRLVKDGIIPVIQPGGRRKRKLFCADVLEQLASQTTPSASRPQTSSSPTSCESAHQDNAPVQIPGPRPKWQTGQLNIKPR